MNQIIQRITSAFGHMEETAMENGDKRGREPSTGAKTLLGQKLQGDNSSPFDVRLNVKSQTKLIKM